MDPILLVSLIVVEAFCWMTMISQANEAPVGFEDERGFHVLDEAVWSSDTEF